MSNENFRRSCFLGLCLLLSGLPLSHGGASPSGGPQSMHGFGASLQHFVPDSEQALNLSYRSGDYGLLSIGMVTEAGYRFGLGAMTTNLGAEAWVKFAGLRLDAVLESDFVERQYAPGIGYRLTVGLGPTLSASVGGQTLYGRGTELVIGLGFAFLGPKSKEKPGKTRPD